MPIILLCPSENYITIYIMHINIYQLFIYSLFSSLIFYELFSILLNTHSVNFWRCSFFYSMTLYLSILFLLDIVSKDKNSLKNHCHIDNHWGTDSQSPVASHPQSSALDTRERLRGSMAMYIGLPLGTRIHQSAGGNRNLTIWPQCPFPSLPWGNKDFHNL